MGIHVLREQMSEGFPEVIRDVPLVHDRDFQDRHRFHGKPPLLQRGERKANWILLL
jgi:hypothetical protein